MYDWGSINFGNVGDVIYLIDTQEIATILEITYSRNVTPVHVLGTSEYKTITILKSSGETEKIDFESRFVVL